MEIKHGTCQLIVQIIWIKLNKVCQLKSLLLNIMNVSEHVMGIGLGSNAMLNDHL